MEAVHFARRTLTHTATTQSITQCPAPPLAKPMGYTPSTCIRYKIGTRHIAGGAQGDEKGSLLATPRRTFGPLAFRTAVARHWLDCTGELWDAQIVPMVAAARWHGAGVVVHTVAYAHPAEMKAEEEGGAAWSEKRLEQLNFLFAHVGGALKADRPPSGGVV